MQSLTTKKKLALTASMMMWERTVSQKQWKEQTSLEECQVTAQKEAWTVKWMPTSEMSIPDVPAERQALYKICRPSPNENVGTLLKSYYDGHSRAFHQAQDPSVQPMQLALPIGKGKKKQNVIWKQQWVSPGWWIDLGLFAHYSLIS